MEVNMIACADTWWRLLTEKKRMNIYFKHFTSGTHDDCIEWHWNLNKEERIKIYEKEGKLNV